MKGLVLGPGVVRTPSLIAHFVIALPAAEAAGDHIADAAPQPLRRDGHLLAVACPALGRTGRTLFSCQGAASPTERLEFPVGNSAGAKSPTGPPAGATHLLS